MHLVGGAVRTLARRFARPGRRGLRRSPASAARRRCSGGRRRSLQRGKPLQVATLCLLARTDRFSGTDLLRPRVAASIGMSFFTMRLTASEIVRPIPAARSFRRSEGNMLHQAHGVVKGMWGGRRRSGRQSCISGHVSGPVSVSARQAGLGTRPIHPTLRRCAMGAQ